MARVITTKLGNAHELRLNIGQESQNVSKNSTTIEYELYIQRTSDNYGGYWSNDDSTANLTINGTKVLTNFGFTYNFSSNFKKSIKTGTMTVTHNSNGKKTVSASASVSMRGNIPGGSGSGSYILQEISKPPPPPTTTESSMAIPTSIQTGSPVTISISRSSTKLTHNLRYKVGSGSWVSAVSGATTSATFTIPHIRIPNAGSEEVTFSLRTYNGSSLIGKEVTRTRRVVVPSEIVPGVTSVSFANTKTGLPTGVFYSTQSNVRFSATVSPGTGATLTSTRLMVEGNGSSNSATHNAYPIQGEGEKLITLVATDSRSRTSTYTGYIIIEPWKATKLSLSRTTANTGQSITSTIGSAIQGATHALRITSGTSEVNRTGQPSGANYVFTPAVSHFPNASEGTVRYRLTTLVNGLEVGAENRTVAVNVVATPPTIDSTVTVSERSAEVNAVSGTSYLQGKSVVRFELGVNGQLANLTSVTGTLNLPSGSTRTLTFTRVSGTEVNGRFRAEAGSLEAGAHDLTITARNSRGDTTTRTIKSAVTTSAYRQPTLTALDAYRTNSSGVADPMGTHSRITYGATFTRLTNNTLTLNIATREQGTSTYSTIVNIGDRTSNISTTTSSTKTGYKTDKAYDVRVRISDKFGMSELIATLPTAFVPLFVGAGGTASAVGKIPTHGSTYDLEIGSRGLRVDGPIVDKSGGEVYSDKNPPSEVKGTTQTRSVTNHGYIEFGPKNTGYAHIYTDRPSFYFNKDLRVNGNYVYHAGRKPAWDDVTGKPSTATSWPTWAQVTGKPAQATRWPKWSEVGDKPAYDSAVDFVIAEGSNYRKWYKGRLEVWGKITFNFSGTTAHVLSYPTEGGVFVGDVWVSHGWGGNVSSGEDWASHSRAAKGVTVKGEATRWVARKEGTVHSFNGTAPLFVKAEGRWK